MKNRILAALLALVLGVPLYLLAADAAPTAAAKTVSSAAPAQAVALLKALPSVEDLAAAMTPEADAAAMIAQTRADLQRESYPIAYDGNNEYYLHHDLYGNYSEYGTIFLDARVPSDFSGHNNVLYGHHMSDGSMFASISNYKQQWYYDAHPYFFLYTNAGTLCTCSYEAANYRYVVLGELVKLEDTPADTATEAAA